MGLSVVVGKVTNDAGRWVKLAEESLAQYCTAVGYPLCYSDSAKKTFLEGEEVCMCVCVRVRACVCVCVCVSYVCTCVYIQYIHSCITLVYILLCCNHISYYVILHHRLPSQ